MRQVWVGDFNTKRATVLPREFLKEELQALLPLGDLAFGHAAQGQIPVVVLRTARKRPTQIRRRKVAAQRANSSSAAIPRCWAMSSPRRRLGTSNASSRAPTGSEQRKVCGNTT